MAATPTPNGARFRGRPSLFTPKRRAISAEPPSSRRSLHTPLDRGIARDLLHSIRRGTPGRNNAPTPHAKAARRALDQRRNAMFTPGKNRRRSLQAQRETPLDVLRHLGRALAPKSKPILTSSSSPDKPSPRGKALQPLPEFEDDEFPIDRPRLSLPLDDDSSSSDLHPYKSSMLEEGNYTVQSVELPRRAVSEQPFRMSLGVFGSEASDLIMNNDPTEGLAAQSDYFPGFLEDIETRDGTGDFDYDRSEAEPTRWMNMEGRESDFNLEMPAGLDEHSTFVMSDPAVDLKANSPIAEGDPVTGANGGHTPEVTPEVAEDGAIPDDGNDEDGLSDDDHMFEHYDSFADYGAPAGDEDDNDDDDDDDDDDNGNGNDNDNDDNGGDDVDMMTDAGAEMMIDNDAPQSEGQNIAGGSSMTKRKRARASRHGLDVPPLPPAFVRRVAQTALQSSGLSNTRISRDTLEALTQASEWFFEQLGDDLGAYASHAKRKTIEESDIVTLMRRQRQIGGDSTIFSTAQRHLPRELLQELRMPPPRPTKQPRLKRKRQEEGDEESVEIA